MTISQSKKDKGEPMPNPSTRGADAVSEKPAKRVWQTPRLQGHAISDVTRAGMAGAADSTSLS